MTKVTFTRKRSRSLSNLYVCSVDNKEVGFIHKPKDSPTDRNAWQVYAGIADLAVFLCHTDTLQQAQLKLWHIFFKY